MTCHSKHLKHHFRVESDESQEEFWAEDAAHAAHLFWELHQDEDIILIKKN